MTKGGRNLVLLGAVSIIIAVSTTVLSLVFYHNSGDIYLDRSRPGYLPEEDGEEDELPKANEVYKMDENGKIDKEVMDEYVSELKKINEEVKKVENPFNTESLGDEALGIKVRP